MFAGRDRNRHAGQRGGWVAAAAVALGLTAGCVVEREPCSYTVCEIEDPVCVEQVAFSVACHRDADPVVPTVRYLSRAELVAEFTPDDIDVDATRDFYRAEALLGLMPEGYEPDDITADSFENTAALYTFDTAEVTMITDGDADPLTQWTTLVHELVHAQQDAQLNLASLFDEFGTTLDRSLALRAMMEGDATMYELDALLEIDGVPDNGVNWPAYFAAFQNEVLQRATETPTPSLAVRSLFPYAFGSEVIFPSWEAGDIEAVEDALRNPPVSVRDVMVGGLNRDRRLDRRAVPVLEGYTFMGGGHRSVWLLNTMLQRTAESETLWNDALTGVGADYLSVFRRDDSDEVVAIWRILGTERLPLGNQWSASPTYASRTVRGDQVLLATSAGVAADVFAQIDDWESPQEAAQRAGASEHRHRPDRQRFILPTRRVSPASFALTP